MKEQPLILVVDDDPAILALVKEVLAAAGYLVDTAASGTEALSHLETHPYDLVLTDMRMPEMGGMELAQHLRLHFPDTLVIIFTGYASYQEAVAAVKLGAFDYLTKPLQAEILQHTVARALEYQRLGRATRDLEAVFQGAEALGVQALELVSGSREAAIFAALRERDWRGTELKEAGREFLKAARDLTGATHSSIFLFDPALGQFSGLAALGPQAEARAACVVPAFEGILGYVATSRHPLLVPDLRQDARFPLLPRRGSYQTDSFLIVPLSGQKFWGVMSLTDRTDGQAFAPRDLFLSWLLGRVLVELLESRGTPEELPLPSPAPWRQQDLPLGLALLDGDLQVLQGNPTLARLAGGQEPMRSGPELFSRLGFSPQDQEKLAAACRQVLSGQEAREFPRLRAAPGEAPSRFLGVKMVPLPREKRGPRALLLVEDVTEREQLKERLHLYEYLAIMGKLTLCVAHELNNPLDGIRRYLSLALLKKDAPQEVERYLLEAQKGLQKMALSIKSLMFSANPLKGPPKAADSLDNLLMDAVKIMMFQASDQRVQVTLDPLLEGQELIGEADLYHVFVNVIKNALQAMPQGGHLRIAGRVRKDGMGITFADTGAGLRPGELEKVFQPFYSTKEGLQGLGLGLPICQKILARYGGRLEVESLPGQGTQVTVILPLGGREP
jgi:signal transduction histidine kinase/CheY-like chemotaxis protein